MLLPIKSPHATSHLANNTNLHPILQPLPIKLLRIICQIFVIYRELALFKTLVRNEALNSRMKFGIN